VGTGFAELSVPRTSAEMRFRDHFHEFLTEQLIDLSQAFNGDLQQMLILAVLGRLYISARMNGAWAPPEPPPSITASRLSGLTVIPRQTVRRKLLEMRAKGWLEQDQRQAWRLAMRDGYSNACRSFSKIDERGIARAIRLAQLFYGAG
jgi:hypothetical protein